MTGAAVGSLLITALLWRPLRRTRVVASSVGSVTAAPGPAGCYVEPDVVRPDWMRGCLDE